MRSYHKAFEGIPKHVKNPIWDLDISWRVRICTLAATQALKLEGDFVETVLQYGAISFNKVREGEMNFNFSIVSTPDQDLEVSNLDLQEEAGDILQSVIAQAISDGSLMTKEEE